MTQRSLLTAMLLISLASAALASEYGAPAVHSGDAGSSPSSIAVPADVATILQKAQAEKDPTAALALLDAYKGAPHPLITLLRGQFHMALAQRGSDSQAHRAEAERAFTAVADQESCRHNAHLGLAQIASDRGDWKAAVGHCAQALNIDHATASELSYYAEAATRAHDWQLACTLVEQGLMRFPDATSFRQLDVSILYQSARYDEARQGLLTLLGTQPGDSAHWREVAWCDRQGKRDDEYLAALELASLSAPNDRQLARTLCEAQLAANMAETALAGLRDLIGDPVRADAAADAKLMELGARAALATSDTALGRTWLAAVPDAGRTRTQRILAARLAVQGGDAAGATAALDALIASGERDGAILVWAGHLAEQGKDAAKAESFYAQAASGDGPAAGNAAMRLGGLYYRQHRWNDATALLATYLSRHPDDLDAKHLQDLVDRGRPNLAK